MANLRDYWTTATPQEQASIRTIAGVVFADGYGNENLFLVTGEKTHSVEVGQQYIGEMTVKVSEVVSALDAERAIAKVDSVHKPKAYRLVA